MVTNGSVTPLQLNGSALTASLDNLDADENVLVVLYGYSTTSTSSAFELVSEDTSSYLMHQAVTEEVEEVGDESDLTEKFHQMLRDDETQLESDDPNSVQNSRSSYITAERTVGSSKNFKVLNSYSSSTSYDTVTATLRYTTEQFEFYVDDRNEDSITDEELETLANDFKVDEEKDLFGDESDVNGDGKFAVLFTQTVNELGASGGGLVTGFFYATDLFDAADYSNSNEMEVFYTIVPDSQGEFGTAVSNSFAMNNIYPTVLPHEFQHMISFNQHYFLNGGSTESAWLNEGLSHLAEDIASLDDDGYMTETSVENPSRVAQYLTDIQNTCFSCGSSLKQRGGSYLFLRYVYEQAQRGNIEGLDSGADLIAILLNTSLTGTNNLVNAVYGDSGSSDDLAGIYGRFALAVELSDTSGSDQDQFQFTGINLRSVQEDNRGTVLTGPAVQTVSSLSFTDSISGNAISYMLVSGSDLLQNGNTLTINIASGAEISGYVVR